MYKGLVACRAGVGSSLMLKIKVLQVIDENKLDITIEHGSLDAVAGFPGDIVITLSDVAKELEAKPHKYGVIGINNIMDKKEILSKLQVFLESKNAE